MTTRKTAGRSGRKPAPAAKAGRPARPGRIAQGQRSAQAKMAARPAPPVKTAPPAAAGKATRAGKPAPAAARAKESPADRLKTVRALAAGRRKDAVDLLATILRQSAADKAQKEVAIACIEVLVKSPHPKAWDVLADVLAAGVTPEIAPRAFRLAAAATFQDALKPVEAVVLADAYPAELRNQALQNVLRRRTPESWISAARLLYRATERRDRGLGATLIETLRKAAAEVYPIYIKSLRAPGDDEKLYAAHALGMLGDRNAIDPLRSAANATKDKVLREIATKAALMLYLIRRTP